MSSTPLCHHFSGRGRTGNHPGDSEMGQKTPHVQGALQRNIRSPNGSLDRGGWTCDAPPRHHTKQHGGAGRGDEPPRQKGRGGESLPPLKGNIYCFRTTGGPAGKFQQKDLLVQRRNHQQCGKNCGKGEVRDQSRDGRNHKKTHPSKLAQLETTTHRCRVFPVGLCTIFFTYTHHIRYDEYL